MTVMNDASVLHVAKSNIGQQLLDDGKLTSLQAEKVLRLQKETGLRFGEAAIQLGFINESDIQNVLAQQFEYPYLLSGSSELNKKLIAAYSPFDSQVEELRSLRSQVLLRWIEHGNKSIAISAFEDSDACNLLAANLAIVFSQLGERTLLVDSNLRNPQLGSLFGLKISTGLSDILAQRADKASIQKVNELRDLSVLTAGTNAPNPQELLARDQFGKLVSELEAEFDVVIYLTAPLSLAADAQIVAAKTKGVLLVTQRGLSPIKGLLQAKMQYQSSKVEIIGCVLAEGKQ